MRAQLESHLKDINRTADVAYDAGNPNDAIDLVVVTDSEAILGIGGECPPRPGSSSRIRPAR
jgi:malate dehydrogenase (oxaloacetate-decarboxylating)